MSNIGRQPLQIVELVLDKCALSYGVAPCTASGSAGEQCYNTFRTCQDPANYDKGEVSILFSKNQQTGIKGQIIYPLLQSVSSSPTRIAITRTDEDLGSLGKRARVVAKFKDMALAQTRDYLDPYNSDRTPGSAATFWGTLRARNPYFFGRILRRYDGYVGDDLSSMRQKTYIITEWSGPDSDGNVEVTAQDIIRLADEKLSQVPTPTKGRIAANPANGRDVTISSSYLGDLLMSPTGIGDEEYPSSGEFRVYIGQEILLVTRSGDTLTIVERGLDGSEPEEHTTTDNVQVCYRVEDATADDVIEDLAQNFAGVPAAYIPKADWTSEINTWLTTLRLTRTIPTPMPVGKALAEICDFGLVLWWDEVNEELRLKVNRPPGYDETFLSLTDDNGILAKTAKRMDLSSQRLSRVTYSYGVRNYGISTDNEDNYSKESIFIDADAEGANEYDQPRTLNIVQPWLGNTGNVQLADIICARLVDRFRTTPQRLEFVADAKDRDDLEPSDLLEVTTRVIQGVDGAPAPTEMQVISVDEFDPGHRLRIIADTYQFSGEYCFFTENDADVFDDATEVDKGRNGYFSDDGNDLGPGYPTKVFF